MKKFLLYTIVFAFLFSCKKKENAVVSENKASTKMYFSYSLFDGTVNYLSVVDLNVFYVKFYKNNSLTYYVRTTSDKIKITFATNSNNVLDCSYNFELSQLEDGTYNYEISDSLNLFGVHKNIITVSNNSASIKENNATNNVSWTQYPDYILRLGALQKKPLFTIQSCNLSDTIIGSNASLKHNILIKLYTNGASNGSRIAMVFNKTANVSKTNYIGDSYLDWFNMQNNFASVSNSEFSFISLPNNLFHSGDSIYFALYPISTSYNIGSVDYSVNPIQYNAISDQKTVIGYKLH